LYYSLPFCWCPTHALPPPRLTLGREQTPIVTNHDISVSTATATPQGLTGTQPATQLRRNEAAVKQEAFPSGAQLTPPLPEVGELIVGTPPPRLFVIIYLCPCGPLTGPTLASIHLHCSSPGPHPPGPVHEDRCPGPWFYRSSPGDMCMLGEKEEGSEASLFWVGMA
jgi:hypothetical protein